MAKNSNLTMCSFCGKSRTLVDSLIAGPPGIYICNECVELCSSILVEEVRKLGSEIPVIQVREIETMLKINNKETAVIGGLMQDQINKDNRGIPFLSSIPLLGALFSYTEEEYVKSELVIFIRPVVMEHASLDGDLADYKKYLLEDIQRETSKKLSDQ